MKPKLLLIDDEQGILDSYSEFLADDFEVHTAENAMDAIKELYSNTYNVAVIDIDFPDAPEGGIDIVNYIEIRGLKTRPIILTGRGTVEKFRKIFKKVYDFIEKGSPNYRASTQVLNKALDAVQTQKQHSYFLSYAPEDSEVADDAELLIRRENRNVFRDEKNVTEGNISDKIRDKIARSDTFIVVWSQNYPNSGWRMNELEYAYYCKKNNQRLSRIIFLKLDETDIPDQRSISSVILFKDRVSKKLEITKIVEGEKS
jgi:DNA-binding NtrC family response regulator